jgi:hypothetical protein
MPLSGDYGVAGGDRKGPGGRVGYYRLYLLDGPNGRFVGFEEIEAADDVEAVRVAETLPDRQARELWCGKRKVKSFAAKDIAAG